MSARKPKPAAAVPARIGTTLTQRTRLGEFLHQWQELVFWKPLLIVLLLVLFYALPRLDPRTGIDGFGDVFHLVIQLLVLAVAAFCAWLFKRTYLRVLEDDEERKLFDAWRNGDHRVIYILVFDRCEWGVLVCAFVWFFGR